MNKILSILLLFAVTATNCAFGFTNEKEDDGFNDSDDQPGTLYSQAQEFYDENTPVFLKSGTGQDQGFYQVKIDGINYFLKLAQGANKVRTNHTAESADPNGFTYAGCAIKNANPGANILYFGTVKDTAQMQEVAIDEQGTSETINFGDQQIELTFKKAMHTWNYKHTGGVLGVNSKSLNIDILKISVAAKQAANNEASEQAKEQEEQAKKESKQTMTDAQFMTLYAPIYVDTTPTSQEDHNFAIGIERNTEAKKTILPETLNGHTFSGYTAPGHTAVGFSGTLVYTMDGGTIGKLAFPFKQTGTQKVELGHDNHCHLATIEFSSATESSIQGSPTVYSIRLVQVEKIHHDQALEMHLEEAY